MARELHWLTSPLPSGEAVYITLPTNYRNTQSFRRVIICPHGSDSNVPTDGGVAFRLGGVMEQHVKYLTDRGYIVVAANFGGYNTFGAYLFYDRLLDLITYMKTTYNIPTGNFAFWAHSMGTLNTLASIRYAYLAGTPMTGIARGAFLMSLAVDLEGGYGLAGYTPPYSTSVALGGFASAINSGYGLTGQTAKNAQAAAVLSGATVQFSTTVNRAIQHRISNAGSVTFTINGFTLTATGVSTTTVTNDTLTGVSSAGVSASWAAAAAVTITYANAGIGLVSPLGNVSGYQTAIGAFPIKIATSTNDATVGYNATPYWIGQIGLANVTEYSPEPALDHNGPWRGITPKYIGDWFNALTGWV